LDLLLSLFPDETEKWQSRFQRERKAKEADCIIAKRTPSKRDLSFAFLQERQKILKILWILSKKQGKASFAVLAS